MNRERAVLLMKRIRCQIFTDVLSEFFFYLPKCVTESTDGGHEEQYDSDTLKHGGSIGS